MHHGKHFRRLNRTASHRKSMLRNLVTQLIQHDRIKTTLPKAQELKAIADQMITLGKRGDLHAKVQAASFLRVRTSTLSNFSFEHETTLPKLFGPLAERFKSRKGGYTRIHKMGNRFGDNAPVAVIELIDGPGDLKNQMLFKALARRENKKAGSIAELVKDTTDAPSSASPTSVAGGSSLYNKTLRRHLPKVLTSNKWELADLEAKIRSLSISGGETSRKIVSATKA
ncbi:MAG: ribosomal protein L17 [Podila humilis]|nr:MAG: ribosomal protein L17 [Podila humilis]